MPEPTTVALAGLGDVGRALLERLTERQPPVRVVAACDTGGATVDADGLDPVDLLEAKRDHSSVREGPGRERGWDAEALAGRAPADVLVQLTPTDLGDPSGSLATIEAALASGKQVVTAAKDALACEPERIRALQRAHGGRVHHSAAVAGSVPILETLQAAFAGDRVRRVEGLLNGSTTYVLSRMADGDRREVALSQAREAGLLEADPTLDLSGRDAGAKAALLHQAVYGSTCSLAEVDVQGVATIDEAACRSARRSGFALRLLARVDEDGARVGPVEVPRESPFALDGPRACLRVVLAGAGSIVLEGPGAGPRETASAVLSDVLGAVGDRGWPVQAAASRLQQSSGRLS